MDASLVYDGGRILIRGVDFSPPYTKWDAVLKAYVCDAIHYVDIRGYLELSLIHISEPTRPY